jgi:uncharacterized coiled-coil DUF342 family protein
MIKCIPEQINQEEEEPLSKHQKIEELSQKLSGLSDEKDKLFTEADVCAEKRNKLNEDFKKLRDEISKLKNERDDANEKVKWLKQRRSELKTKIHEKIEELKTLNQEAKTLMKKEPSRDYEALQKEFEDLEWRIQTTTLSMEEEKELVERVKQTELQLSVFRKLEKVDKKILQLRNELKALDNEGKQCHESLTGIAQKSQELHQKMLTKVEESKKIKAEADSLHKAFVQAKEKLKPIQDEMTVTEIQIKQLKGEIREEEAKGKKQSEDAVRDKLERQAREKMKRGEKLTWDEFQILAEKGMGEQDQS